MTTTIRINSLEDLPQVAQTIVAWAGKETVWLLNGEMGAGKTTLSKAIAKVLGVVDTVSSPTFAIINEYATHQGVPVYHFDFYRLKNEHEALAIGVEDYFYSNHICLVEWGSQIPSLLPDTYLSITIQKHPEDFDARTFILQKP